jgi:hypothetical protein
MEQRRYARFAGNQAAWISIYGKEEVRIPGQIKNVSGRGIGLEVGREIGTGTAVKIEVSDSMLLGEAMYCRPEGDRFYVGVQLDQALYSLMALSRTVQELTGSASGAEVAHALHQADRQDE